MILDWHGEAREEFLEAVRYYDDQVEGLGERFPYSVIYRIREEDVQILAVAHAKRRPG